MVPTLKKVIVFSLLIGVFLGVSTLYRELRLNQITKNTVENYLKLQNEIQNYLNIAENRNNIANGNNSTLNQIYNKYADKNLLALLILDDNKNIVKMVTRQSISKRTLEVIKPSLNHEKKIIIKEKQKLSFINFSPIKNNRGENLHFNLIFRLTPYLTTRINFEEAFNFYTPIAFLIFIIILTITIFNNRFSFKPKKTDIIPDKRKTVSPQPPVTSDITNIAIEPEPEPDPNLEQPSISSTNALLIKQFILKDYSLSVYPLYPPTTPNNNFKNQTNKIRNYNQIWELNEFYHNQFTKHPLCHSVINNLTTTISLNDFIKSCFADFLHLFPDFLCFYFSAKSDDSYAMRHYSPISLITDSTKHQKFVPFIGKEKKYFLTHTPYIQTVDNSSTNQLDHSMICFPLITPRGFRKALVKIIIPNSNLDKNRNFFHRWSALLSLAVEHFQIFPEKKTSLNDWFNRRYFIHLLKTCSLNLNDTIFEAKKAKDIQQKIVKINIQKKTEPTSISESTLIALKEVLDRQFNQHFIFALQKETTTIWATPKPSKTSKIDRLIFEDLEKSLSNAIKDNLCHALAIKKKDLRTTVKSTPVPKHLKNWNILEKNKLFWMSSR